MRLVCISSCVVSHLFVGGKCCYCCCLDSCVLFCRWILDVSLQMGIGCEVTVKPVCEDTIFEDILVSQRMILARTWKQEFQVDNVVSYKQNI